MIINETQEDKWIRLQPVGDIDAHSSIDLDTKIQALIDQDQVFIHVDFSEINYISSAGWGVFTFYFEEVENKGGKIRMSNMKENVADVFNILGLDQLFNVV